MVGIIDVSIVAYYTTFLWQTQIQTIKYGLNDIKRIKKPTYIDAFSHLHPLIWIFKQFDAQSDFVNFLSQVIYSLGPFLS